MLFRHGERAIDGRRSRAPVFVQLQADRAGLDLLAQRLGRRRISLAQKSEIDGKTVGGFQHAMHIPRARRARRGVGARRWAGAAADQRCQPAGERGLDQLRANKMDVRVNSAGRHDFSFSGDHFRARADDHSGCHAVHDVRIAGLADSRDASVADSDVGFVDSAVVHDHRIGDHQIESAVRRGGRRGLAHAVANHFAAAEFRFFAGSGQVLFNFDEQFRVGQADAIAGGWAVEVGVLPARNFQRSCQFWPFALA